MAGALFSRLKVWATEILTKDDLNAEFDNILNNLMPSKIDDASANETAMQAIADPYPGSSVSLPTSTEGEFQRIRYVLKQITGKAQWYYDPDTTLSNLATTLSNLETTLSNLASAVAKELIINLKPVVNVAVNKLDIFSKSAGTAPDASNPVKVMIPDGNGYTQRTRAEAYLSGTSQIILADATDYWSKGSLDAEIKTAWLYAIWDGTGIVWALGGYSGFNSVPTTTTATDDDYFLLEASSTYTRSASHYCVAVAKIRYQYDTADTPDHTIQSNGENAPQVIWNARSDYGYSKALASTISAAADITSQAFVSLIVKQSGKFYWSGEVSFSPNASGVGQLEFKTGSATYASATLQRDTSIVTTNGTDNICASGELYLNAGDSIHLGGALTASGGIRKIRGASDAIGCTMLTFRRVD